MATNPRLPLEAPPEPPAIDGPVWYRFVATQEEVRQMAAGQLPPRLQAECAEALPWLDDDVATALRAQQTRTKTRRRRAA